MYTLDETKYTDLNNTKKLKTVKDVQKAAYSQGYSVSDPKHGVGDHYDVELTHRKSGEKVKPRKGGQLGGSSRSGDRVDSTLVNQVASTIKGDAAARGRVDKRPKAKAKHKEEMKANLAAKQKRRAEPFGRKADGTTTKKRTFESFMLNCVEVLTEESY